MTQVQGPAGRSRTENHGVHLPHLTRLQTDAEQPAPETRASARRYHVQTAHVAVAFRFSHGVRELLDPLEPDRSDGAPCFLREPTAPASSRNEAPRHPISTTREEVTL